MHDDWGTWADDNITPTSWFYVSYNNLDSASTTTVTARPSTKREDLRRAKKIKAPPVPDAPKPLNETERRFKALAEEFE